MATPSSTKPTSGGAGSKKSSTTQRPSRTPAPFLVSIFNWNDFSSSKPKRHSAIPPLSARASTAVGTDEHDGLKATSSPSSSRKRYTSERDKPLRPSTTSPITSILKGRKEDASNGQLNGHRGEEKLADKDRSSSIFSSLRRKKKVEESNPPVQSKQSIPGPSQSVPTSPSSSKKRWFGLGGRAPSTHAPDTATAERVVNGATLRNGLASHSPPILLQEDEQSAPLSFAQRIKLHKGLRTGKVPVDLFRQSQSQMLLAEKERDRRKREKIGLFGGRKDAGLVEPRGKGKSTAFSADAINELDPYYLSEALLNLADDQPIVARSIPKHYVILPSDEKKAKERLRKDCLFEEEIYDQMLSDSQNVLDMLQSHLSECITGVRAKSPTALSSPFSSPPMTPILSRSQSSFKPAYLDQSHHSDTPVKSPSPSVVNHPRVKISVSGGGSSYESQRNQRYSAQRTPSQFPIASGGSPWNRGGTLSNLSQTTTDYRGGLAPSRSPMMTVRRELATGSAALPPLSPSMNARKSSALGSHRTPPFPIYSSTPNIETREDRKYQYFAA